MSLNTNQMTAEERKKNREKFMIKDKENETIYKHYGDLNGADFKLRKNKNCEIYILDWSKGMYIDDCEDCKIFCGPIDGSIFIRGSKNCEISIIARQVRFRGCENIKVFTYCPSDPAVESSFNIYFAPFNAFFPHLKELFVKGEFKKEEKNHIDTPYDFTTGEVLGGGAPHFLKLSEDEFYIKVINDGDAPVEEMFEGYSQEEPWIQNKSSDLPKFGESKINIENNEFNFTDNENNKNNNNEPISQPTLNDFIMPTNTNNEQKISNNDNNFTNMDDFLSNNFGVSGQNNQNTDNKDSNDFNFLDINNNNNSNSNNINTNTNNNNYMELNDFFGGKTNDNNNISNQKENIDFNSFNNNQNNNNLNDFIQYDNMDSNKYNRPNNLSKEQEEELKRQELRNKEKEIRQAKIREKMEKEAKMKMEIMKKASEYMTQFYEERQKRIAMNHEKLMQGNGSQNNNNNINSGSPWGMVESSFTGSSSNADRMKEAILNRNRQEK
jgi:hypothetical protein